MAVDTSTPPRDTRPQPRPYLNFCQSSGVQGHMAKRCPLFQMVPIKTSNTRSTPPFNNSTTLWQPRAHFVANITSNNPTWLLDSGVSHHVTTDLSNLSLHALYTGSDDVIIRDGTGFSIVHIGSTSLFTLLPYLN